MNGKKHSALALFFATILIVPFQTWLFISLIIEALAPLVTISITPFQDTGIILVAYLMLPIIYCTAVTLLFRPKRLVSPLNVQIGSVVVFMIIIMVSEYLRSTLSSAFFVSVMGALIIVTIIAIPVGIFQFLIVRWVTGLNFEDNLDRITYSIDADFRTIAGKMMDTEFLYDWGFNRKRDIGRLLLYKLRWAAGETVIFALGEDKTNVGKAILATVAFQQDFSLIHGDNKATHLRDNIITVLSKKLTDANPAYTMKPLEQLNDQMSIRAYFHAKNLTRSKVEITRKFFEEIPSYYTYAIAFTLVALIGLTIVFWLHLGNFDLNTYVSVAVVIFIALLTELGLSLREELSSRKIEEIEDLE